MQFSRRELLQGSSVLAISTAIPSLAKAWTHGSATVTGFNGGVTQTNQVGASQPGSFQFLNFIKGSGGPIVYLNPPTDPTAPTWPLLELDSNGYPQTEVAGTGGYYIGLALPRSDQYTGTWVLKWDGTGTVSPANFTTSNHVITSNRYEFTNVNNDGPQGWTSAQIFVQAFSNAPNHVRNIVLCRSGDEAKLTAGQVWNPDHINLMTSAKPGCVRSLGWGGCFNGTNSARIGLWNQRMPSTYISYFGALLNPNWCGGTTGASITTTNSGSDYTLAYSGFTLTDKRPVQLIWNVTTPQLSRATIPWSTTSGVAINVNWNGHGLSAGNVVVFGQTNTTQVPPPGLTSAQFYYINNVIDANNFTVSATSGGSSVLATATNSGISFITSIPRININSTGFVPITDLNAPIVSPTNVLGNSEAPRAGLGTIIYDQTIGYFVAQYGDGIPHMTVGSPPELFIDYCAAVGAHPHLTAPFMTQSTGGALGGCTDYMTSWVNYAKNTYPWMKPIIEPFNECWNGSWGGTSYAYSVSYALWPSFVNSNFFVAEGYGKFVSDLGQAVSSIYGNDRTKYSMICAVQAVAFHSAGSVNVNDSRLTSALYVSQSGGQPAYKFTDRVCTADYYNPTDQLVGVNSIISGFGYYVTNFGSPSGRSAIAESYAATALTNVDTFPNLKAVDICFTNLKAWGLGQNGTSTVPLANLVGGTSGNTVKGILAYEGGWGPDPGLGNFFTSVSSSAGSITNANPAILTLDTNSTGGTEAFQLVGNPGVANAGQMINLQFVSGMNQINNNLITCTFTNGSASISAAQTLSVNQGVSFYGTPPTPFSANTTYFVISTGLSNSVFELSATQGGSAITATTSGGFFLNGNNSVDCTFTNGSASIVAVQALLVNQAVMFINQPPTPFQIGIPYHVISTGLSNSAFQLSATKGGSAITATASGSSNGAQAGWFVLGVGVASGLTASQIALDVDSTSFGSSTTASTGLVTWTGSGLHFNTLNRAAADTNAMATNNVQMYSQLFALGGGGFIAENPSNFLYFGYGNNWFVLDPNIYAPLTPQWNSIVAAN